MGIIAYIYKNNSFGGDTSNGGISSEYDEVIVVNCEGPFNPSQDRRAVELVHGAVPGIVIARPVDNSEGRRKMFGGSYIGCSDSRFGRKCSEITGSEFYGAVPLHDRME